jgi:hypothetical protein
MLILSFVMHGQGRKMPWLLLRYRPRSPLIEQKLISQSGQFFFRNLCRWGCDTVQSGRNLPTDFKTLRRSCLALFAPRGSGLPYRLFGGIGVCIERLSGILTLRMTAASSSETSSTRTNAAGWRTPCGLKINRLPTSIQNVSKLTSEYTASPISGRLSQNSTAVRIMVRTLDWR